jgi:hypothetical protein
MPFNAADAMSFVDEILAKAAEVVEQARSMDKAEVNNKYDEPAPVVILYFFCYNYK